MLRILRHLTLTQRRILLLKIRGWRDLDIARDSWLLGFGRLTVQDVRDQIDALLFQLLEEIERAKGIIERLYSAKIPTLELR